MKTKKSRRRKCGIGRGIKKNKNTEEKRYRVIKKLFKKLLKILGALCERKRTKHVVAKKNIKLVIAV